jgi:hypothetical protein
MASATLQLVNGLIEITGNVTLIEPSTAVPVPITIPFTM